MFDDKFFYFIFQIFSSFETTILYKIEAMVSMSISLNYHKYHRFRNNIQSFRARQERINRINRHFCVVKDLKSKYSGLILLNRIIMTKLVNKVNSDPAEDINGFFANEP